MALAAVCSELRDVVLTNENRMDISFPAAALILSDMVPRHLQGVAASLVNTVVNYSISIGIGVAGTVEREVHL